MFVHVDRGKSERRLKGAAAFCLGLLNVFLLAGVIVFGLYYYNSVNEVYAVKANLSSLNKERDQLKAGFDIMTKKRDHLKAEINVMTEDRDQLKIDIDVMTKQWDQLKADLDEIIIKTCLSGWTKFSCSCYFFSNNSGSWETSRDDCRTRGSDLVVLDSKEEQIFLVTLTNMEFWIGLNDIDQEGIWKWVDGSPLNLTNWAYQQPDNGGGDPQWGEEDCAHIPLEWAGFWNDLSCNASLPWICEKSLFSLDV